MKYTKEKLREIKKEKLREIKNQSLEDIRNYLEDNYADKILTQSLEFIEEYILDLETELELQQTFAQEENKPIIEKTHYEE